MKLNYSADDDNYKYLCEALIPDLDAKKTLFNKFISGKMKKTEMAWSSRGFIGGTKTSHSLYEEHFIKMYFDNLI